MTSRQILDCFSVIRKSKTLLDIGCGEEIWGIFASTFLGFEVTGIDIDQGRIDLQRKYSRRLKPPVFKSLYVDAARMPFPSESFDVVNCFAVLPLIPGDGDSSVMREVGRVLKRGGRAYITVGYDVAYLEQNDTPSTKGFSRVYDEKALEDRLIKPSGLRLEKRLYFVEPFINFSNFWYRLPFILRLFFRAWALPLLSLFFLKEFDPSKGRTIDIKKIGGVLLVLEKQ